MKCKFGIAFTNRFPLQPPVSEYMTWVLLVHIEVRQFQAAAVTQHSLSGATQIRTLGDSPDQKCARCFGYLHVFGSVSNAFDCHQFRPQGVYFVTARRALGFPRIDPMSTQCFACPGGRIVSLVTLALDLSFQGCDVASLGFCRGSCTYFESVPRFTSEPMPPKPAHMLR